MNLRRQPVLFSAATLVVATGAWLFGRAEISTRTRGTVEPDHDTTRAAGQSPQQGLPEPLSPDLALVDPELADRARAALAGPESRTSPRPPGGDRREPVSPAVPSLPPSWPAARGPGSSSTPVLPPPSPRGLVASRGSRSAVPVPSRSGGSRSRYPLFARITVVLWLLLTGILIGGAAIPHAKERPTVVPPAVDATSCQRPSREPVRPSP
jgi:hypothetical protein